MAKKLETKFREGKVIPFLKKLPLTKYFSIQQLGKKGDPDLLVCCNGEFVAMELKVGKGKVTKLQEYVLGQVYDAHGYSWVVCPENWARIKDWLTAISKGEKLE